MIRRFVGLLFGAALIVLGSALPAAAHDQLIASSPAEGEVLSESPALIELEFNAEIIDASPAMIIQDDAGETIDQPVPTVDGRFVRAPFPEIAAGPYRLNWSVVSSDGHRIEGTIAFTLAGGGAVVPTDDLAEEVESESPSDVVVSEPARAVDAAETPLPQNGLANASTPMKVMVGFAGIAAFGAVAALAVRRLRARREDQQ
ncbi:MAG: copper resistance protein CopC [Ruaniaceae bacterium]|nr:copper resistance protein CopC [Ruaniaceae bacterium]